MFSSHIQQAISSRVSSSHEWPWIDETDTVHHGPGPHCSFPPYQYQEVCFAHTPNPGAFTSQSSYGPSYNAPLWYTQVDGPPTPNHSFPSLPQNDPISPTSSVTPPPFPAAPFSLPNADQFIPRSLQDSATSTEWFLPQGVVNQQQPVVYNAPSSDWDKNYCISDQFINCHDPAHQYTFCFESPSLGTLAEGVPSSGSYGAITSHVSSLSLDLIDRS